MRFPKFLIGMLGVLIAFAATTYAMTNSFWTTVTQTVVCAVLIQIGYFGAVLFLVMRENARNAGRRKSLPTDEANLQKPSQPFNTSATKAP
ncbi:exopolysaccharide production repressor protein [Phyllobacterium leguminum]|uniref:Exopolysaccharide production repressor n=1 Tax=Phyllobacterium leguminum TaxID=314237 RepID=A0A318T2Q5_9HYPH|nr:exopolysaccharide production repressor protein [Phyllobacterium leguminum]PYE88798.1 exopolysaccharide production repressor [Phyllobacterium leguminum]